MNLYDYNFEFILLSEHNEEPFARIFVGANDMSPIQDLAEAIYRKVQQVSFRKNIPIKKEGKVELGYRQRNRDYQPGSPYVWNAENLLAEMKKQNTDVSDYLQTYEKSEWLPAKAEKKKTEREQCEFKQSAYGGYNFNYSVMRNKL